jgi:hypothetical protein
VSIVHGEGAILAGGEKESTPNMRFQLIKQAQKHRHVFKRTEVRVCSLPFRAGGTGVSAALPADSKEKRVQKKRSKKVLKNYCKRFLF